MDQNEWLRYGIENGFCTPPYCDNHDAYHAGDWGFIEELQEEFGNDFCLPVVRVKQ